MFIINDFTHMGPQEEGPPDVVSPTVCVWEFLNRIVRGEFGGSLGAHLPRVGKIIDIRSLC